MYLGSLAASKVTGGHIVWCGFFFGLSPVGHWGLTRRARNRALHAIDGTHYLDRRSPTAPTSTPHDNKAFPPRPD